MQTRGVLQAIRERLEQGQTSGALIAMGFAPGSVYKAQGQLRQRMGRDEPRDGAPDRTPFRSQLSRPRDQEAEVHSFRAHLAQVERRVEGLSGDLATVGRERDQWHAQAGELRAQLTREHEPCPQCGNAAAAHWWCGYQWNCPEFPRSEPGCHPSPLGVCSGASRATP